jgi:SAM-dependent methyltransferase
MTIRMQTGGGESCPLSPVEYWNSRAETFSKTCERNAYAARFIERLAPEKGQTVFDMGCAAGTLAVPLARAGHRVFAADFAPKMIEHLEARIAEEQLPISTTLMAWQDDWSTYGFSENAVDVALASRSIPSDDLAEGIGKLDRIARYRAAVTVPAGSLPLLEPRLLSYLGRPVPPMRTDTDVIGILADLGRFPELSYIPCERPMKFDSFEQARAELHKMAGPTPFTQQEQTLFEDYVAEHVYEDSTDGVSCFRLDYTLMVSWAFIRWSTEGLL